MVLFVGTFNTVLAMKLDTGDDDDLSDLQVQRKAKPNSETRTPVPATTRALPNGAKHPLFTPQTQSAHHASDKILLVDDDVSDNNNVPGNRLLSASDEFYRLVLQRQSLKFDSFIVRRYANGPTLNQIRGYSLIIWYTGESYGGDRDNTAVISSQDEATLRSYLNTTGGSVILISPGYLNNVMKGAGTTGWTRSASTFLQQIIGAKGGYGLLQRFKQGTVSTGDNAAFVVNKGKAVETQFSALNPDQARTLFTAPFDPDGKGQRAVTVASVNNVGRGKMIYVGFTFENIANDAGPAFDRLLKAAGVAHTTNNKAIAGSDRSVTLPGMTLIGSCPTPAVNIPAMSLVGSGPVPTVSVPTMSLIGSGPTTSVTVPAMSLIGSEPLRPR